MTEDQGRDGLETGPSQLATLGLMVSAWNIGRYESVRVVVDVEFGIGLVVVDVVSFDDE